MPRPKTHDDALRVKLLDRAGELLSEHGPQALSLRKLATDAQTSTTAVYSLFGGKPALVRELYVEAFRRFGERLAAVSRSDSAVTDLVELGLAYREAALADRHLYSIMFGKPVPEFEPDDSARTYAREAMRPLLDVVRSGLDSGEFSGASAEVITVAAWGLVHGLVSLELSGTMPENMDVGTGYAHAVRAHVDGWRTRTNSSGSP